MDNVKQANINIKLKDLFIRWLEVTRSFHNLPPRHQQILALFLYYHHEYSNEITNNKILWDIVFNYDTKLKIEEELGISNQSIQNFLTKCRKNGIIKDGKINQGYIPSLSKDSKNFKIIFNFNIINE